MNNRTLAILVGAICVTVAGGVAFMARDTWANSSSPMPIVGIDDSDGSGVGSGDSDALPGGSGDHPGEVTAVDGVFRPSAETVDIAEAEARRPDTTGWTKGVIRGDIQLAVSVLDRLGPISVIVEEARSNFGPDGTRRQRLVVPVQRGRGTPTFEVTGIEFSDYPFTVTVHASGLNGSQRTVVVNKDQPLVDDVVLSITPGAPFSVLLRDQDGHPHCGVDVRMAPIGEPHGRAHQAGVADNFGSVVFDDVLAGDYQLTVSTGGQPLGEPQRVTVQPGARMFRSKIQGQGHVVTIPRGVPLELNVSDAVGYAIQNARVTATATDRTRLTELVASSDGQGLVRFPHLQAGIWQISIECEPFQRIDLQMTIAADNPPPRRDVRMVRARR